jgi:hypothetical protein
VHFYRNVLVQVPKRSQAEVSEAMKAVFVQRDEKSARQKAAEVVRQFQHRYAKAMETFEAGIDDMLSYLHYPAAHRIRISSTNPIERLNLEIRRVHPGGRHLPAPRRLFTADRQWRDRERNGDGFGECDGQWGYGGGSVPDGRRQPGKSGDRPRPRLQLLLGYDGGGERQPHIGSGGQRCGWEHHNGQHFRHGEQCHRAAGDLGGFGEPDGVRCDHNMDK